MGKRMPGVAFPFTARFPDGREVEFADERAAVLHMLRCEHKPPYQVGYIDPARLESKLLVRIGGCTHCGSWFQAVGPAFEGIVAREEAREETRDERGETKEAGGAP